MAFGFPLTAAHRMWSGKPARQHRHVVVYT
jgi:hypothetical protein